MHANEIEIKFTARKFEYESITTSQDIYNLLRQVFDADTIEHKEEFWVILLNRNNKVLGVNRISSGGISGTVVDMRIVFQAAIKSNASSLILSHNHPSGNLTPSEADINITNEAKQAGKYLKINVLDHIIMTYDNYMSFADSSLM